MKLEYVDGISVAHPYTKGIEHEFHCKSEVELDAVTRGHFSPEIAKQTAKDIEGVTTGRIVYTSTYYIGLGMKPKDGTCSLHHTLSARAPTGSTNADPPSPWTRRFPDPGARKQLDISYPTNEFVKQVKMWETFESRAMSIVVAHVKGYVVRTCISPVSLMICSSFSSKLPDDVFGPGERPTELLGHDS